MSLHHHCMATPPAAGINLDRMASHNHRGSTNWQKPIRAMQRYPRKPRWLGTTKEKGQMKAGPQDLVRMWSAGTGWICEVVYIEAGTGTLQRAC